MTDTDYVTKSIPAQADTILGALATASAGYSQVTTQAIGLAVAGHVLNGSLMSDPESALDLIKEIISQLNDRFDLDHTPEEHAKEVAKAVSAMRATLKHFSHRYENVSWFQDQTN